MQASPTQAPTYEPTLPPLPIEPPHANGLKGLALIAAIVSLTSGGYLIYRLVLKMKGTYNEIHDP
jgi:hypothetical protein